jgi:hypothetical protein
LILGSVVHAEAQQSWLCTADDAAGFSKNGGDWKITRFKPSMKFLVKPLPEELHQYLSGEELKLKYGAFEFGKGGPRYCRPHWLYEETWDCSGFYFNKTTLRFLNFFLGGYVHSLDNTDTPNFEIGTCTIFD